ncbi:MAG TPA: YciI family protein [Ramlibacter sp.]|nr:YciI family protein [Ramlibacter sp.]
MPQYMIFARDGTDAGALERRRSARTAHLLRIDPFVRDGSLIFAGATLDDEGRPTGSAFAVEFNSIEALRDWIAADPYTTQGVWKDVRIELMKVGVRNGRIEP